MSYPKSGLVLPLQNHTFRPLRQEAECLPCCECHKILRRQHWDFQTTQQSCWGLIACCWSTFHPWWHHLSSPNFLGPSQTWELPILLDVKIPVQSSISVCLLELPITEQNFPLKFLESVCAVLKSVCKMKTSWNNVRILPANVLWEELYHCS